MIEHRLPPFLPGSQHHAEREAARRKPGLLLAVHGDARREGKGSDPHVRGTGRKESGKEVLAEALCVPLVAALFAEPARLTLPGQHPAHGADNTGVVGRAIQLQ